MIKRNIPVDLELSLLNNEPYEYFHLVKFEKPKKSNFIGAISGRATDYAYITDAPYNIDWDDQSIDSLGNANGVQTYVANKLESVGSVQETTEVRANNLSLKLSSIALGTSITDSGIRVIRDLSPSSLDYINTGIDLVTAGFREGDIIELVQDGLTGNWIEGNPYTVEQVAFNEDGYYVCIAGGIQSSLDNEPGVGVNWETVWDRANHLKKVRIERFATNPDIENNNRIYITSVDGQVSQDVQGYLYTLTNVSEELNALTFAKGTTLYSNYINREVFIYRGHISTTTGELIGSPFLLFKGIISQGSIQENKESNSTITWTLSSHWADFVRVQGRLTSDDSHRALTLTGRSDPKALIRPEYASDYGFMHSDRAVNAVGVYQAEELRYKTVKRGGLGGWLGGKKVVEYYETVDREVDLRLNLAAKYLPVVYGVQRVSAIPVFADLAQEDASKLFVLYALCEGEIAGIYDIYIDETPSVCQNEPDQFLRNPTSANEEDSTVDVICYGRADKGEVLGGAKYVDNTAPIDYPFYDRAIVDVPSFMIDGGRFTGRIGTPVQGVQQNQAKEAGLLHETTFSIQKPLDATFVTHSGKPNQLADNTWVKRASELQSGNGFKVQAEYFEGDPANYWSDAHQLLDTAYVSTEFTIGDGEATLPNLDFIVKGRFVECYNYDNSFVHDVAETVESADNFSLGDLVSIQIQNPPNPAVFVSNHIDAKIIDKWYEFDKNGEKQYRFRTDVDNINFIVEGNRSTRLRLFNGVNTWTMLTYDHNEATGEVGNASSTATVSSYSYTDNLGAGALRITVSGAGFESLLNTLASTGNAFLSFNTEPNASVRVTAYNNISKVVTLEPNAGAISLVERQNYASGNITCYISNLVTLQPGDGANAEVGNTIKLTRFDDGIPDHREGEISSIVGDLVLLENAFEASLVPNIEIQGTALVPRTIVLDRYTIGLVGDPRTTTNPAMQLLDYLTNKRFGKGISVETDVRLESFLESARLADDRSEVTFVADNGFSGNIGQTYAYSASGTLFFQGKLISSTPRVYNGVTYHEVVFTDCIGKLGRKWLNEFTIYEAGELVWGFNNVRLGTGGTMLESTIRDGGPASNFVQLQNISGGNAVQVRFGALGGVRNTNTIARSWTPEENAFSSPGYSLYDSDDVKYWKYLGWDQPTQRWVTRHQMNQVIQTDLPLFDNINSMLKQFNGIIRYSNGRYELDIKTAAPDFIDLTYWVNGVTKISENDIIGEIKLDDKGTKNSYNSITANIVDPQNRYDARSISFFNSEYLKEDKGVPKKGNFSMPGVSNYYNARTNIVQFLDESRYGLNISFKMDQKGYLSLAGNIISLTYPRFSWEDKLFRIESLTLQTDSTVAIVAKEHNDDAFLIEYSDRNRTEQDAPQLPVAPNILEAPLGLTATTDQEQFIKLNWTHSGTYNPDIHSIEVRAIEAQRDELTNLYIEPYQFTSFDNTELLTQTGVNNFQHLNLGTEVVVYFYWVRYVQQGTLDRVAKVSKYFPLSTEDGVIGSTIAVPASKDAPLVVFNPYNYFVEADSFGNVSPGVYPDSGGSFEVLRGGINLTPVTGTPTEGEFTAIKFNESGITGDINGPSINGAILEFDDLSNFQNGNNTAWVDYQLNIEGNIVSNLYRTTVSRNVEGSDAWQIGGTNVNHIFIADASGEVLTNDFSLIPFVTFTGIDYSFDSTEPYAENTFRYDWANLLYNEADINAPVFDPLDGNITIPGDSEILLAGGPVSTSFQVPILNNATGGLVGFLKVGLSKVFSGSRNGLTFNIVLGVNSGTITAADVIDWTTPGDVAYESLVRIAQTVIDLSLTPDYPTGDGFIRPNDRITITDIDASLTGTRIFAATATDVASSVTVNAFSSLVVEFFDGSVIVDGTLSANKLAADTAFVNNIFVASNLIVGSDAVGPGFTGAMYTYQKTSFEDTSAGFYLDHTGAFVVSGEGLNAGYLKYDPNTDQVTIKGNLIVDGGNTQVVTWKREGTCTLDSTNTRISVGGTGVSYAGSVTSNTALGAGATASCEPFNNGREFKFGLSDTPLDGVYTAADIEYGWEFVAGIAYPILGINRIGTISTPFSGGDLMQVVYTGSEAIWFKGTNELHRVSAPAAEVYSWKGVFKTVAAEPSPATIGMGMRQGAISVSPTGSPAASVDLVASDNLIDYNSEGLNPLPTQVIFDAVVTNLVGDIYYEFIDVTGGGNVILQAASNSVGADSYVYSVPADYTNVPKTIEVRIREGSASNIVKTLDRVTINGLKSSESGLTIAGSNDSVTLAAAPDGTITNFVGSSISFEVYLGATKLVYDDTLTANNSYRVTQVQNTNITGPTTPTIPIVDDVASFGNITGFTADNGSRIFTFEVKNSAGAVIITSKVQSFSKSKQGISGPGTETVTLLADKYVISYDKDGLETNTVTLTAEANNIPGTAYFRFSVDDGTLVTQVQPATAGQFSLDTTYVLDDIYEPAPGENVTIIVEVSDAFDGSVLATDKTSIIGVQQGSDGINGFISNAAHSFSASNDGIVASYGGSGTELKLFQGAEPLIYNGVGTTAKHYTINVTSNNITPSSIPGITTSNVVIGDHSNMLQAEDEASITYNIVGKDRNNIDFTWSFVQTFTKAKAGAGSDAYVTKIETVNNASSVIIYDSAGLNPNPSSLDLIVTHQNLPTPWYRITNSSSPTGFTSDGSFSATGVTDGERTITWAAPADITNLAQPHKIRVGVSDGGQTELAYDFLYIYGVRPGEDGAPGTDGTDGTSPLLAILSDQFKTIRADSTGTPFPGGTTDTGTEVSVYEGSSQLNYDGVGTAAGTWSASLVRANVTGGTISQSGNNALDATVSDITSLDANTGHIDINISGTTLNSIPLNLSVRKSFVKSLDGAQGDQGTPGLDGENGLKTAFLTAYRRTASNVTLTSNPGDKPSVSSTYTFSTSSLSVSNLGNSWSTSDPGVATGPKLWITTASAASVLNTATVDFADWANPVLNSQNPTKSAVVYLYRRTTGTTPALPTGTITYTFDTGLLSGTLGNFNSWTQAVPSTGGDILWVTTATALADSTSATASILLGQWSTANRLAENGADGSNGLNTAVLTIFNRTSAAVTNPSQPSVNATYNFTNNTISTSNLGNGWNTADPGLAAGEKLWISSATASSATSVDTILSTDWSDAILNAQDGTKAASLALYTRTSGATPTKPSTTLTYTFSSAILSGTLGVWSQSVPSTGGDFLWITTATASARNADLTDSISGSEWTIPTILTTNGADGADGAPGATGDPGVDGTWGAAMYVISAGSTASTQITPAKIDGVIGRNYAVEGDVCIVQGPSGGQQAYRSLVTTLPGVNSGWNWVIPAAFINGDLVVAGSIDAEQLRVSNYGGGVTTGVLVDGANNRIDVYVSNTLRVRLGKL